MDNKKRIIVDIDNTLWDFASEFYRKIKVISPNIPPISQWTWDFYMDYISLEDLASICNEIHMEQDIYKPFEFSQQFLSELISRGCHVIIASHREEKARQATERFFIKYNLPYTELHLTNDKTLLFNDCVAVVDDAPHILDEAKRENLICTGLEWPWNRNSGHILFKTLEDVLDFLIRELKL